MRSTVLMAWGVAAFLAVAPATAETLLVVRKTDNALDLVDPGSGLRLASVTLGHAPHEVSVSPDGRRAAVTNYGTREQPGSTLSIVDLVTPREIRRIDLAPHTRPHGVHWYADTRIAVTAEGSRSLLVVDPDGGSVVTAIETAQDVTHMVAVTADGARAYATNIGSGTTTALDLLAGRKLADVVTGKGSEALALTPDGRGLWVAARAAGVVVVVDTTSLEVVASIPVEGTPIRLAFTPDGRTALVTCAAAGRLVAIDVASRTVRGGVTVDVPLAPGAASRPFAQLAPGSVLPIGLQVGAAGRMSYVAATMGDAVVQYETATLEPVRTITVGGEPDGLATTPVLPQPPCHAWAPQAETATRQ